MVQDTMATQTLDGSMKDSAILASCLYAHHTHTHMHVHVWANQPDSDILYPVGVDSYGALNGSNNVKELRCHIHQS